LHHPGRGPLPAAGFHISLLSKNDVAPETQAIFRCRRLACSRPALSLRDQQPLDDRRNESKESWTLRKSFVSAQRRGHTIGHKVIIRAIKNIRTGAEITYNYGRDYLTNVITRRGCKCDKCRKKRADARAKGTRQKPTSPAKPKRMGKKK
jgi:hypothetical protein